VLEPEMFETIQRLKAEQAQKAVRP
jgi:hypothetical protein